MVALHHEQGQYWYPLIQPVSHMLQSLDVHFHQVLCEREQPTPTPEYVLSYILGRLQLQQE